MHGLGRYMAVLTYSTTGGPCSLHTLRRAVGWWAQWWVREWLALAWLAVLHLRLPAGPL